MDTKRIFTVISITIFAVVSLFATTKVDREISIVHGPYLQQVTETEATVIWVTDKPGISWVEIAPNDGSHFYEKDRAKFYQSPLGSKLVGTVHTIKIDGLKPATTYNYRIFTRRVLEPVGEAIFYGKTASSVVYRKEPLKITTLDSSKKELSFVVINDIHERSASLEKMLASAPKNIDFVLYNGDMVNYMGSEEQIFKGFMDVTSSYQHRSGKNIFYARGNHESRGAFASNFMKYFPTPTGKPYYTYRVGPVMFVSVDAGEDKPDNDIEYHNAADFDNYRERQAKWLEDVVNSKEFKDAPVKILISHIPPAWGSWHGSKHFQKCFADIINKAGFSLIISGHLHSVHELYQPGDVIKVPNMVNTNKEYMIVDVDSDNITMQFRDENGKKSNEDIKVKIAK